MALAAKLHLLEAVCKASCGEVGCGGLVGGEGGGGGEVGEVGVRIGS